MIGAKELVDAGMIVTWGSRRKHTRRVRRGRIRRVRRGRIRRVRLQTPRQPPTTNPQRASLFTCVALIVPLIYNHMVVDYSLTDEGVDRIFQALADRTRRDILRRAIQSGESVSVLSGHYEMSFAAVQKHVAVLERAGLVTKERRGREQIVHTSTATIRRAMTLLDAFEQLWIQRVDQITDILALTEGESR